MIEFPQKRIWAIIGKSRSGKDTVAKYLQETRGFASYAFADKIKAEFGISKGDFEISKINGQAEQIRKDLWEFSDSKTSKDSLYFVRKILDDINNSNLSAIITDIRTPEEFNAFFYYDYDTTVNRRVFYISSSNSPLVDDFENSILKDSRLPIELISQSIQDGSIQYLLNNKNSIFYFYQYLDSLFFKEDVIDLHDIKQNFNEWRSMATDYLNQFTIIQKV